MTKPWQFLFWLVVASALAVSARAADRITATVTVTNYPAIGDFLTINGSARQWSNVFGATSIATNTVLAANGTNLYRHLTTNGPAGPVYVTQTSPTNISLLGNVGQAMAVTASGSWASIGFSTQVVAVAKDVRVPFSVETATNATNIASQLVSDLSTHSTTAFASGSIALSNYAGIRLGNAFFASNHFLGSNVFTGSNTLIGPTLISRGTITNLYAHGGAITNAGGNVFAGSSTIGTVTVTNLVAPSNSYLSDPVFTNAINRGRPLQSYSNNQDSVSIGYRANASTNDTIAIGEESLASALNGVAIGTESLATAVSSTAVGVQAEATGVNSAAFGFNANATAENATALGMNSVAASNNTFAVGYNSSATALNSFAIGTGSSATHSNAIAIGHNASTTVTNQVSIGSSDDVVSVLGAAAVDDYLLVGGWARYPVPASFQGGIILTNGVSAAADPANAVIFNAASGEWIYRTSASSEGAGQNNRVHNRAAQVVGSGANYSLTGSSARVDFGGTDPDINTLPSAGTYLITALVAIDGANSADEIVLKLYNSTGAADIADSQVTVSPGSTSQHQGVIQSVVTVTGADRIQLYGHNSTAARGSIVSTETKLTFVRLH